MLILALIITAPLAAFGCYLIYDFAMVSAKGQRFEAEIIGFQKKKNKWRKLPMIAAQGQSAQKGAIEEVRKIGQLSYILNPPIRHERIEFVRLGKELRAFGYINLCSGILMVLPVTAVMGAMAQNIYFAAQVVYIFLFAAMALGGWVFMKFIQRNY